MSFISTCMFSFAGRSARVPPTRNESGTRLAPWTTPGNVRVSIAPASGTVKTRAGRTTSTLTGTDLSGSTKISV